MALYKIRHTKTGKYSSGGLFPTFSEHGVRWTSLQQLVGHISCVHDKQPGVYQECVVVEVTEQEVRTINQFDLFEVGASATRTARNSRKG